MICRIWRGWTTPANAPIYQSLLVSEILPGIAGRAIPGYRGAHLARRAVGDEVEFITLLWFDSMESVRAFAGEDYQRAVVPPKARAVLSRFDEGSAHYQTVLEPGAESRPQS